MLDSGNVTEKTNFAKLQIMQILIFFVVVRRLTNTLFF